MAESRFVTDQYTSEHFVESVGAVCIHRGQQQICVLRHVATDDWYLPKGRRNVGEHRQDTAVREVYEETGIRCRLMPVTMTTRAPPAVEAGPSSDSARLETKIVEPFMLTCRHTGTSDVKIIWWYVATVEPSEPSLCKPKGEPQFETHLLSYAQARSSLTYRHDREVLEKALEVFVRTIAA